MSRRHVQNGDVSKEKCPKVFVYLYCCAELICPIQVKSISTSYLCFFYYDETAITFVLLFLFFVFVVLTIQTSNIFGQDSFHEDNIDSRISSSVFITEVNQSF